MVIVRERESVGTRERVRGGRDSLIYTICVKRVTS